MESKQYTYTTPWGSILKSECRPDKNDYNTAISILQEDEYFLSKLPLLQGTCLDIGSFIGNAACAMIDRGATVRIVEILPENIEMIKRNLSINGMTDKAKIYHAAISNKTGDTIEAYYTKPDSVSGKHHQFVGHTIPGGLQANAPSLKIQTISLDDLVNDLDTIPLLKIDCEGGEWSCFEGASLESLQKINYIVGELHCYWNWIDRSMKDFIDLLKGQFVDISNQFGIDSSKKLTLFVLKNKRLP